MTILSSRFCFEIQNPDVAKNEQQLKTIFFSYNCNAFVRITSTKVRFSNIIIYLYSTTNSIGFILFRDRFLSRPQPCSKILWFFTLTMLQNYPHSVCYAGPSRYSNRFNSGLICIISFKPNWNK